MSDRSDVLPALVADPVCCAPLAVEPLDGGQAATMAKSFKALGDPVRLRLLSLIASASGETCVCDLTAAFDLTGATISHHLKVLREAGLVDCQRRGTWVYYWPIRPNLQRLSGLLDARQPTGAQLRLDEIYPKAGSSSGVNGC